MDRGVLYVGLDKVSKRRSILIALEIAMVRRRNRTINPWQVSLLTYVIAQPQH